jgi:hypothetical protein
VAFDRITGRGNRSFPSRGLPTIYRFRFVGRSTSHYELSVLFFVVRVDTNSDIDPVHPLKNCLVRLVQNVN